MRLKGPIKCDECGREAAVYESRHDPLDQDSWKSYCLECNAKADLIAIGFKYGYKKGGRLGWRGAAGFLLFIGCYQELMLAGVIGIAFLTLSFNWIAEEQGSNDLLPLGMFFISAIALIGSLFFHNRSLRTLSIIGLIAPIVFGVFILAKGAWDERQARIFRNRLKN